MRKILAVARNTFREAVRNRIFASLIFFTLALLICFGVSSGQTKGRLMTDVLVLNIDSGRLHRDHRQSRLEQADHHPS